MKNLGLTLILASLMSLLAACGDTSSQDSITQAVPNPNYQIKLNGQCWDNTQGDVHAFLRSCTGTQASKWRLLPFSGLVYNNNSDYVRIVSANSGTCLTDTRNSIGQGDLSLRPCTFAGSPKADIEAQKFYINNTSGVIKIFGYKDYFLTLPNPKAICVVKNPNGPLISENVGCTVQQSFNLVLAP